MPSDTTIIVTDFAGNVSEVIAIAPAQLAALAPLLAQLRTLGTAVARDEWLAWPTGAAEMKALIEQIEKSTPDLDELLAKIARSGDE